jgi:hypothetical protein
MNVLKREVFDKQTLDIAGSIPVSRLDRFPACGRRGIVVAGLAMTALRFSGGLVEKVIRLIWDESNLADVR